MPTALAFSSLTTSARIRSPWSHVPLLCDRLLTASPHRKLNTSPATLDDKEVLKKPLCLPKVKKIDLHFPLGLEVTARNLKGVTIKDALDAIYKQYKKKVSIHFLLPPAGTCVNSSIPLPSRVTARSRISPIQLLLLEPLSSPKANDSVQADDELDLPILAGFEWDKEECYTRFVVHQKKEGAAAPSKKKKKGGNDE